MMKENLKCPFCSNRQTKLVRTLFSYHVECPSCLATGNSAKSKKLAVQHWIEQSKQVRQKIYEERGQIAFKLRRHRPNPLAGT